MLIHESVKVPGELIAWETNITYTRVSARLVNNTGAEVSLKDVVGYPLKDVGGAFELCLAGEEATVDSIIVQGPVISALPDGDTTKGKYAVLVRGPAAVRPLGVATKDVAGDDFDVEAILAALATKVPIIIAVDETVDISGTPNVSS